MKAQLKPVVWTVLPKMEFSTTYLFEEQGTSESSEWFQIDLKCDQGALSDSYISKWDHSKTSGVPYSSNKYYEYNWMRGSSWNFLGKFAF